MLKFLCRRLRGFMQAEIMAELAAMRADMARRDELVPLVKQMEAALLTIALAGSGEEESKSLRRPGPEPSGAIPSVLRPDGTLGPSAPDPH